MKNRIIASIARIAIPARDQVERIKAQKNIVGNNRSIRFFFLRNDSVNTGKNAVSQNQKLVGLSNK